VQRGEGADVVLLHGAGVNLHDMLTGPVDALAKHFRVTVFDRPGHGHSDADLDHASPLAQAEKLHAAAWQLGLVKPVIVGHSLGGAVALAYGAKFPSEIAGIVAMAPLSNPIWGPGQVGLGIRIVPFLGFLLSRSLLALSDPLVMRLALRAIFKPQQPTERFRREFPNALSGLPLAMRADAADFISATRSLRQNESGYARHPSRVHVLVGSEDKVLNPSRHAEHLASLLPDATLTILPGLGHMFHHFNFAAIVSAVNDLHSRDLESFRTANGGAPNVSSAA
jgi:pimeloyl-ACP methyl ester carboxylesterase